MDCRGLESVLPDLLDGKKDAEASAHLAACTECRTRFRDLATTAALVADLADAYTPPSDADAATERLLYERLRRRPSRGVSPVWLFAAACVGAILAVVLLRRDAPEPEARLRPEASAPPGTAAPEEPETERVAAPGSTAVPGPATASPTSSRATKQRRFREVVRAAHRAATEETPQTPIEPLLDAYAESPDDAEEELAVDATLGGYFADELRPRLLHGYVDRATASIERNRWLEGCEAARLAKRLAPDSDDAEILLLRCEAEAERISRAAEEIEDASARRTMLRGALLVATPGSTAYRSIERTLAGGER